jgi:hypothetical protein
MAILQAAITRFAGGVNNRSEGDLWGTLAFPDPSQYNYHFDDFNVFNGVGGYSVGGAGSPSRVGTDVFDGGAALVSTSAGANDSSWIQTPAIGFRFVAGKRLYFSCKANLVTTAANFVFLAGLQIAVSGNAIQNPVNGVYFRKPVGGTSIFLVNRVAGVEVVSASLGNVVANQTFECAFFYPGDGNTIIAGFRANAADSPPVPPFVSIAGAPPSVLMGPIAGIDNGGTATGHNFHLDQLSCVKER